MGTVDDDVLLPRATSLDRRRAVVDVDFALDDDAVAVEGLVQHFSCCG